MLEPNENSKDSNKLSISNEELEQIKLDEVKETFEHLPDKDKLKFLSEEIKKTLTTYQICEQTLDLVIQARNKYFKETGVDVFSYINPTKAESLGIDLEVLIGLDGEMK